MPAKRDNNNRQQLTLKLTQIDAEEPGYAAWQVVLDYIEKIRGSGNANRIRLLPKHWRAVYTTIALEAEVCNGGHHQFFWNTDGILNEETLADLQLIRAKPFVAIFKKALAEYAHHDYATDKIKSDNSWEGFTAAYREKRMNDLDTAFYKQSRNIESYLTDYIRNNRKLFCDDTESGNGRAVLRDVKPKREARRTALRSRARRRRTGR